MINLLPPEEKNNLLKERARKLLVVLGFVALVSLLCFVLMLLALYFDVLAQVSYQKNILDDVKKTYQTADFLYYKNIIGQYNIALITANDFYKKEVYFSDALKIISQLQKPSAVRLKNIAMEITKDTAIKISVLGTSDTRENLLLFKNSVEATKEIAHIYFPPDNWIKPKDVNFYFTFEINEKPK